MRCFEVLFNVDACGLTVARAVVRIADELLAEMLTDDWQRMFYDVRDLQDAVAHVTYLVVHNRKPINHFDGFAHFKADAVQVVQWPVFDLDMDVLEVDCR